MIEDPVLDICRDFCAEAGDPPCFELARREGEPFKPCDDCMRAAGFEVPDPLDPGAVVRPLL